ncbi:MAG: hypothetical protein EPN43_00120 [Jatrophihabitans sp.]|nr:MAG: hypothetical protein EPN43_00120 [Jatrophihabitans sp.]
MRKGPPHPVLRLLGPVVIASSVAVLGTGIGLVYVGPQHREPLLTLHQGSFVVWFVAMSVHVLGHVLDAGATTWRELRDPHAVPATRHRRWRTLAVTASLVAGVALATAVMPAAHSWTLPRPDDLRGLSHSVGAGAGGHGLAATFRAQGRSG